MMGSRLDCFVAFAASAGAKKKTGDWQIGDGIVLYGEPPGTRCRQKSGAYSVN